MNIYLEDADSYILFLSHVVLFNFIETILHPSARYPPGGTYDTSEIDSRTTYGSTKGKVYLSLNPDCTHSGSYFFRGSETESKSSQDSSIIFF